jgi:hypothetical protein
MMTLKHVIKITSGIIGIFLSTLAYADSVTITLDSNFPSDYTFYSYTDTSGVAQNSIPVSPYLAVLNGDGYFNQSVLVICYDMNADTTVGKVYTGTMEPISYFSGDEQKAIMEASYLVNELNVDGGLYAPLATRGALSLAIWEITNASSTTKSTPFPTDPAAVPYENEAIAAVTSGAWTIADANQYQTWMPDSDEIASIQRFGEYTPTPEPSSFVLMGWGLLGLGLVAGRSRILIFIKARR